MHISDLVGQYNRSVSQPEPVSGQKGVERLVSSLSELSKGNIFEGTVSSVKGGRVTLALSNGQQISARLDGKLALSAGQSMFFQVKSNNGTQVEIRPYTVDGAGANLTLMQALKAAGLPLEADYLSMVNKMMEENMPIDKGSVTTMAKSVQEHTDINVNTLVQMEKLGIKLTPEMASQFENYLQDKQAIGDAIDDFITELGKMLSSADMSEKEIRQITGQVLSVIVENQSEGTPIGEVADLLNKELQELFSQADSKETSDLPEDVELEENNADSSQEAIKTENGVDTGNNIGEAAGKHEAIVNERVSKDGVALGQDKGQTVNNQTDLEEETIPKQQNNIASGDYEPKAISKEFTANQALNEINRLLTSGEKVDSQKLVSFLAGKEFNQLLKEAIQDQWMIKPKDVADSKQINRLYEKMEEQLQRLADAVKASGQDTSTVTSLATEIRNNVEFMNQINEAYTYIQIPLKMSGQSASGELYVYTNKKNLEEGDRDLTAFLHLDMEHLGGTDVSVKMHGKDVTTNFYMDSDEAYALLRQFLPQLEERLKNKGYNCRLTVINQEKHVNFVENFLKKDQPSAGKLHRYSFDMRA